MKPNFTNFLESFQNLVSGNTVRPSQIETCIQREGIGVQVSDFVFTIWGIKSKDISFHERSAWLDLLATLQLGFGNKRGWSLAPYFQAWRINKDFQNLCIIVSKMLFWQTIHCCLMDSCTHPHHTFTATALCHTVQIRPTSLRILYRSYAFNL